MVSIIFCHLVWLTFCRVEVLPGSLPWQIGGHRRPPMSPQVGEAASLSWARGIWRSAQEGDRQSAQRRPNLIDIRGEFDAEKSTWRTSRAVLAASTLVGTPSSPRGVEIGVGQQFWKPMFRMAGAEWISVFAGIFLDGSTTSFRVLKEAGLKHNTPVQLKKPKKRKSFHL